MKQVELQQFNNSWYKTGANFFTRGIWYCINTWFFYSWIPGSKWRVFLLKLFGAEMGKSVIIKPYTYIKYPWNLTVANTTWIGEFVWLDNLDKIYIGNNCCISQGAYIFNGNHNYKKSSFDLIVKPIVLEDGVWIGAKCVVTQGVICKSHSILAAGSRLSNTMEAYEIWAGNPAKKIRMREISE